MSLLFCLAARRNVKRRRPIDNHHYWMGKKKIRPDSHRRKSYSLYMWQAPIFILSYRSEIQEASTAPLVLSCIFHSQPRKTTGNRKNWSRQSRPRESSLFPLPGQLCCRSRNSFLSWAAFWSISIRRIFYSIQELSASIEKVEKSSFKKKPPMYFWVSNWWFFFLLCFTENFRVLRKEKLGCRSKQNVHYHLVEKIVKSAQFPSQWLLWLPD